MLILIGLESLARGVVGLLAASEIGAELADMFVREGEEKTLPRETVVILIASMWVSHHLQSPISRLIEIPVPRPNSHPPPPSTEPHRPPHLASIPHPKPLPPLPPNPYPPHPHPLLHPPHPPHPPSHPLSRSLPLPPLILPLIPRLHLLSHLIPRPYINFSSQFPLSPPFLTRKEEPMAPLFTPRSLSRHYHSTLLWHHTVIVDWGRKWREGERVE